MSQHPPERSRPDEPRPDESRPDEAAQPGPAQPGPGQPGPEQPGPERPGLGPGERPASWMGARGYTPYLDDLPPHAPMPGAPPYPADVEHPPPPVGAPRPRTGFPAALGAAAVWAVVNVVLVLVVEGPPPSAASAGRFVVALVVPLLLAALGVWLVARQRAWSFVLLALLAFPFFWVLRAIANLLV